MKIFNMRTTHFELLRLVLGDNTKYLDNYFESISGIDTDDDHPIDEDVFDRVFSPEAC